MNLADIALLGLLLAYGAGVVIVGSVYWESFTQEDVDKVIERVEPQLPAWQTLFTPVVRHAARLAWALLHGLLWPRELWLQYKDRRGKR